MMEKYQEQMRKQAKEIIVLRLQIKDVRLKYAELIEGISLSQTTVKVILNFQDYLILVRCTSRRLMRKLLIS